MVRLVGREQEMAQLTRASRPGRLLSVAGPSGVGKTALVKAWIATRDHSLAVECRERTPVDVASELAESQTPLPLAHAWESAGRRLTEEGVEVLLLDDVSPDYADLGPLREEWSGTIVTTSHHAVEGDDVAVLPLTPMIVPPREELPGSPIHQLFVETARTVDLSFELSSDEDLDALHGLAKLLAGFPLGLAVTARRAPLLTTAEVLRMLQADDELTDPTRAARHQSLRAAVDLSLRAVDENDLARLFAMSMFERPVRIGTVATLLDEPLEAALEGLQRLVQGGFVMPSQFPAPLELFGRRVRELYPAAHPDEARELEERALAEGVRLARERELIEGAPPRFAEGPSLWKWAVESQALDTFPPETSASVLQQLTIWLSLGTPQPDLMAAIWARVPRAGRWQLWNDCTTFDPGFSEFKADIEAGCELGLSLASDDTERARTFVRAAHLAIIRLDGELARDMADRALELDDTAPHTLHLRALIERYLHGDRADAEVLRKARKPLEAMLESAESPQRRVRLLNAITLISVGDEATRVATRMLEEARELQSAAELANARAIYVDTVGVDGTPDQRVVEMAAAVRDYLAKSGDESLERVACAEAMVLLRLDLVDQAMEVIERHCPSSGDDTSVALGRASVFAANGRLSEVWPLAPDDIARAGSFAFWGEIVSVLNLLHALEAGEAVDDRPEEMVAALLGALAISGAEISSAAIDAHQRIADAGLLEKAPAVPQAVASSWLRRRWAPALQRLHDATKSDAALYVMRDGSAFRSEGEWTSWTDDDRNRLIVATLTNAEGPLDFEALGEVIYPDEVLEYESLRNRINVAFSGLRKNGLKPFLVKTPEGFLLRGDITIEDA